MSANGWYLPHAASRPQRYERVTVALSRLDLCADDFAALWLARFDLPTAQHAPTDSNYLIVDTALTIVVASDDYLCDFGLRANETLGRPFFEVLPDSPDNPDQTAARLRAVFDRLLRGGPMGTRSRHRYDIRLPDGTFAERWWLVLNLPLLDREGRVCGVIHTARPADDVVHTSPHQP